MSFPSSISLCLHFSQSCAFATAHGRLPLLLFATPRQGSLHLPSISVSNTEKPSEFRAREEEIRMLELIRRTKDAQEDSS